MEKTDGMTLLQYVQSLAQAAVRVREGGGPPFLYLQLKNRAQRVLGGRSVVLFFGKDDMDRADQYFHEIADKCRLDIGELQSDLDKLGLLQCLDTLKADVWGLDQNAEILQDMRQKRMSYLVSRTLNFFMSEVDGIRQAESVESGERLVEDWWKANCEQIVKTAKTQLFETENLVQTLAMFVRLHVDGKTEGLDETVTLEALHTLPLKGMLQALAVAQEDNGEDDIQFVEQYSAESGMSEQTVFAFLTLCQMTLDDGSGGVAFSEYGDGKLAKALDRYLETLVEKLHKILDKTAQAVDMEALMEKVYDVDYVKGLLDGFLEKGVTQEMVGVSLMNNLYGLTEELGVDPPHGLADFHALVDKWVRPIFSSWIHFRTSSSSIIVTKFNPSSNRDCQ